MKSGYNPRLLAIDGFAIKFHRKLPPTALFRRKVIQVRMNTERELEERRNERYLPKKKYLMSERWLQSSVTTYIWVCNQVSQENSINWTF